MITAVDTSVVIDILTADPRFGPASLRAFCRCLGEGGAITCEVVWTEVTAGFETEEAARDALARLQLSLRPLEVEAALLAGQRWREYRLHGGSRARIVSDFLVGAHAQLQADRLLTRDRGFYRS